LCVVTATLLASFGLVNFRLKIIGLLLVEIWLCLEVLVMALKFAIELVILSIIINFR
jgi:hypothetical protein